jgi:hypothetical protein
LAYAEASGIQAVIVNAVAIGIAVAVPKRRLFLKKNVSFCFLMILFLMVVVSEKVLAEDVMTKIVTLEPVWSF